MIDMTKYGTIYFKILISLGLCFIALLAFRYQQDLEKIFDKLKRVNSFLILSILFRIIPFIIVYVILHFKAQSDVIIFWKSAQEALKLKLVYRDFESLYSPLFPYITALLLFL